MTEIAARRDPLSVEKISLAFGGVKALTERELRSALRARSAPSSAQRRGQVLDAERDQRRLPAAAGPHHASSGEERAAHEPQRGGREASRVTFQNIALFKGMTVLDNIMTGRNLEDARDTARAGAVRSAAPREELEHRKKVERIIDSRDRAHRKTPVGRLPYGLQKRVELARALAAEPRAAAARRAHGRHERRRKEDMCRFILDVNDEFGTPSC
jgi:branched-chain amino acid transport system ATP-binding protein